LNRDHPELHIRLIDLKQTASSLPQSPPAPIGPVFVDAVSKLVPDGLSLDTFNSLYLQRHSTDPQATLASAKVSHKLKAPRDEVETLIFALLAPQVQLNIPTALSAIEFLTSLQSSRVDEFKVACQSKFEHSTVFKNSAELAVLSKQVLLMESDALP